MGAISSLLATQTPTPNSVPISDGSGTLNAWVTNSSDIQAALDTISNVHGSILFRGATQWEALAPGVPGSFLTTNGAGVDPSWSTGTNPIYDIWVSRVDAAMGTYEPDSKSICSDLADQLVFAPYYGKLVYLLPLLGANIIAARVPLIDALGVGIAGNTNFVDADFSQATGLQGDGSSKFLDTLIKAGSLGVTSNGGMGVKIQSLGSGEWSLASRDVGGTAQIFGLALSTSRELFYYGDGSSPIDTGTPAGNNHYYGQRSSAIARVLYRDGVSIGTSINNASVTGISAENILCSATQGPLYSGHLFGYFYLTDGTLTAKEITAFHTLLQTYLITPTGR